MPTLLEIILPFREDLSIFLSLFLLTFVQEVLKSDALMQCVRAPSMKSAVTTASLWQSVSAVDVCVCLHVSHVLSTFSFFPFLIECGYISLCAAWLPGAHWYLSPLACMFTQVFKFHNDNQTVDHRHRETVSRSEACSGMLQL